MDESTRSAASPGQSNDESAPDKVENDIRERHNERTTGTLSAPTSMSEDDMGLAWKALPRLSTGTSDQELKVLAVASRENDVVVDDPTNVDPPGSKQVFEAHSSPQRRDGNAPQKRIATEVGVVHVSRAKRIAMNRRARRRSQSPKKRRGHKKGDKKKETGNSFNWFATAKHALENVAAGMVVAANLVRDDKTEDSVSAEGQEDSGPVSESELVHILKRPDAAISEIQKILLADKSLVRMRQPNGWFPLHVLCNRPMPNRSTAKEIHLTDHLVADIQVYIRQLDLVYSAKLCCLPIH